MSQMTRDLFDSVERENDLTEQLKFTEEETKMMRKKLHELEEENERLNVQLKKLSKGSSKCSKKESSDKPKIIVTDPNDSDSSMTDDTDTEDELNIVEVKLQLGLLEQELSVSHRKITDVEQINENLQTQIKVLNEQLAHREQLLSVVPTPPSPNSYYLDKIKEMTIECDDLRWKIIEKDRAIERLSTQAQAKAREGKLKKARSLDSEPHIAQIADLRRQIDIVSHEAELFKDRLASSSAEAEKLAEENARLRLLQRVPSIQADDAAIENIELRDKGKRLEDENKNLQEKIKVLTDNLQTLTRTPRSPTTENPPSPSIADGIYGSRDLQKQLERILEENKSLREKMADLKQQQIKAQVDSSSKTKDESTMDKAVAADTTAASDSRDHLMETILDLEDEIESIKSKLRDRESENIRLEVQVTSLQEELEELKDESQNTELELMREIEMIHDKNSVLTNLLDIVNERAETAEKELEQQYQHHSSPSERSASAVSALSGASVGSDDVFLVPPSLPSLGGDKSMVVNRDWEGQFKKRISSLERLLAEERQKVHTVEKKLRLADPDMHTSGMSDDVKLHLREKELLQDELLDHQKNMRIATDQIKGFKERLSIMEEENLRLRMDYGKLCDELDQKISEHEKTPENELEPSSANSLSASPGPRPRSPIADTADIGRLKEQCAKFKLKAEELEYKVEELNEIWRSKSAVLEQSKKDLENEIASQGTEMAVMKQTLETLKKDLCEKEKRITEQEAEISEKNSALNRREDFLHEQDDVIRQRDTDFQTLLNQVSQREETIKNLRENVRTRDERLKEKDGYIEKLNKNLEERQKESVTLQDEIKDTMASVKEKEVIIAILQQQISESCIRDTGSETDIEKENARLKQALRSSQSELQKSRDEKDRLLGELEKSRKALNEAMLLWEKNRSGLQTDLNILMEKLRLYEINTTMDRNDIILNLKADTERYYKEKEKLACEIHNIRTEHDVDNSALKEQVVSLQVELTEKCQQLKEEVEIGTRLQQEVDRLTAQAEMAYRLQQEEKILRAEYLAMKVRYETRIDKMSRDYSRALVTVESLEKERELDKEIIKAAQKGMLQLKDSYTQDLIKWEDEKQRLEKHGKEIEDSRELAREMKRKIQEFKEKVMEQDNLRSELINRCATERASGEIERANLQSKINQLQEQLTLTTQVQSKVRDKQSSMETTWEKERSEQKRLLTEAHSLALDLQQQIKARDAEFSTNRRDLLKQVDLERQNYERERKVKEKALADLEVLGKKFVALQLRFKELQERSERDQEIWLREKNDLRRRIMETKLAHTRDTKRIDDILSSLIKLREIGALIAADEQETASSKGNQSRDLHQNILKYIKESVAEITFAADQLANETSSPGEDKNKFRRSLSSSELNLLKEQLSAENSGSSSNPNTLAVQRSIQRSITYDSSVPLTSAAILPPSPSPRLSDRPPSYSSGSRSAQSSRAQTPDSLDRGSFSHLQSSPFQQPSSLTIPSTRLSRSTDIIDDPSSRNNNRPKTLIKSVSMDTPSSSAMSGTVPSNKSVSVTTTPTFPTSESFTSGYNDRSRSDDTILSPAPSNFNRLTPRSARKKFFEQQSPASPGFGYLSWPDRKSAAHHQHQSSLPVTQRQMSEIAQPATFAVPAMRTSASMDEKMHYQMNIPSEESLLKPKTLPEERERGTSPGPKTAKEKRKFFKKSSSLDSTVGSSILKIGMQAIPPAAPTGFAPTDIFSTIKGKLKGKKSKETLKTTDPGLLDESISNSESTGDIDKPPASFQKESSPRPPSTPTTPQTSSKNTTDDERASAAERGSRSAAPPGVDAKRWRSKSAERPQRVAKPIMVHSDVITPMQVWQFSETAV
ncbi:hypothetical protein SNE40_021998 [Patella caerulea]|uniref:Uncharacterized protein n=1 Tax=Patella caerulea TaxID=87958 RepID=A0AAN8IXE4_PATCE